MAMPRIYRSMRRGDGDLPIVGTADKWSLGVRGEPIHGVADVDLDCDGNVVLNGKGMSVSPAWRVMPPFLIPKRLRDKRPGATAPDHFFCFVLGTEPFEAGPISTHLLLRPDSLDHGVVAPNRLAPLKDFQAALAATQPLWRIDES